MGTSVSDFELGFYEEVVKIAVEKEAIRETLRVGGKAFLEVLFGGKKLIASPGMHQAAREGAVIAGKDLMRGLEREGLGVHRARVKSPSSMQAKGITPTGALPDDLLGMQLYGKSPADVERAQRALESMGAKIQAVEKKERPGYHGVNIKAVMGTTPVELQVVPGRTSLAGSIMEHSLGYKQKTEAPMANAFDKWVGKTVAPKLVGLRSWVPQTALAAT
jgi:hypothetical protein